MNVISLYLPLWVAASFANGEIWYAVAYSLSMAVVMVISPAAGADGRSGTGALTDGPVSVGSLRILG